MTTLHRSAQVPFSPNQMFDLVNDIEQYPQFLPWCPKAEILARSSAEIEATVHFAKGILAHSFTTVNRLKPHEQIEMHLREGPFRRLEGIWKFFPHPQGSQVSLSLSFEFNSKLLAIAAGPLFFQMASTLLEAFTQRANQVYGG